MGGGRGGSEGGRVAREKEGTEGGRRGRGVT